MLTILTLLLLTSSSAQPVRHFQKLDKKSVPFTLFRDQHKTFDHEDATEASVAFLYSAAGVAFAGDLNDDGTDELLIVPDDGTCGSSGCEFYLFGDKEGTWVALAGTDGGIARDQSNGLDILPIVRRGYHDIRILDDCVKWNGRRYVPYEPADYRQLSPDWFDHSDFWSAVILWRIECEGLQTIKIVPQWVTGVPQGIQTRNSTTQTTTSNGSRHSMEAYMELATTSRFCYLIRQVTSEQRN